VQTDEAVELACLAREHHDYISHEQVAKLVRQKVEVEKGARRYRDAVSASRLSTTAQSADV
jgi:hypothetical protein